MTTTQRDKLFAGIFQEAHLSGMLAGQNAGVQAMVVQQHANLLDDNSPVTEQYFVADGVIGFAWVTVRPANSPFANWLKKNGKGKTSSYQGGVTVWAHEFRQSLQRKEAYASAFADVLNSYDIKAYSNSRID